ncbi:adenylate/guanylate cyclase domain-containing protein [Robertkochia flava]|uniref:adenylate/guanylate cyclase domain-containing protein n=1 Tax=Robertkochia flava TaxID=3447986 RepID=UPI001CCBDCC7|nr:adenylate/guanylate cyclase domain-containing protein [Robertkochia marina]
MRLFIHVFIVLFLLPSYGQVTFDLESLKNEYLYGELSAEEKFGILRTLSKETPNVIEKLAWGDSLIEFSTANNNLEHRLQGHLSKAWAYNDLGNYLSDISETLAALEIADSIGKNPAQLYNHLANVYGNVNNTNEAIKYYLKSIELHKKADSISYPNLIESYYNYSNFLLKNDLLDSALVYLEKAREATQKTTPQLITYITPYLDGNTGVYYFKKNQYDTAKPLIEKGVEGLISSHPDAAVEYYNYLADIAQEEGDLDQALAYSNKALEITESSNSTSELENLYLNLFEIERERKNYKTALEHFLAYQELKDSLINLPTIQKMYNLSKAYEVSNVQKEADLMAKEAEIQELRANRQQTISIIFVVVVVLLSLLLFGLFNRVKYVRKTSRIIEQEKERSDALLKNILPDETANELKANGKVNAKQFDSVTVLFADFCGFTKYSSRMQPQELVERVDFYFSRFDAIMEKYDLEKIKTIGDAYMCAGGLPYPHQDHALRVVLAAFEMIDLVQAFKKEAPNDPTRFDIRIGINTGPVVAGVVGTKKFVYDIWGDTVNIASRMESNSEAGQINVSEDTYKVIKNTLDCTFRGMVDVKHKGMMKMYFVDPLTQDQQKSLFEVNNITVQQT